MVSGINTGYYDFYNKYNNYQYQNNYGSQPFLIERSGIFGPQQIQQPTTQTNDTNAADGKNDGKIGFGRALGNLLKGAVKFVTSPFTDEQGNFSIGQTLKSAAIGLGLAALTCVPVIGPAVVPTMLAAGITFGTIGAAKATANILTAKTDAEDEAAWQSLGGNLTAVGLSLYGAKKYANANAADGKAVGLKDSVKKVFKDPYDIAKTQLDKVSNMTLGDIGKKTGVESVINKIDPTKTTAATEAAEGAAASESAAAATESAATESAAAAETAAPKKPIFNDTREKITGIYDRNKDQTLSQLTQKVIAHAKAKLPELNTEIIRNNKVPFAIGTLYTVGRTTVKPDFYSQLTPAEQQYYDRLPDEQKQALVNRYYAAA